MNENNTAKPPAVGAQAAIARRTIPLSKLARRSPYLRRFFVLFLL